MLQVYEKGGRWLWRLRRRPKIIAIFSFRYDYHLVPDLLSNIESMVDGWISFDDRQADVPFTDESGRRRQLISRAREIGADWVLAMDPDERLEAGAATTLRRATRQARRVAYTFRLRELYSPNQYRIDGVWGEKVRARLFPLLDGQVFSDAPLHAPWHPLEQGCELRHLDINLYHLKMIRAERRAARAALYRRLDPESKYQKIGYDYLADDTGMVLESIPPGREYLPPHKEDGGLWMPDFRQAVERAAGNGSLECDGSSAPETPLPNAADQGTAGIGRGGNG